MQKIIPFKKEMPFKSAVAEITSISLEHTLHKESGNLITGLFIVSGDYKVVDTSNVIDHFSFEIPFDIHMDDKYNLEKVHIDIDDFYYEIINNESLMVNIDVLLDKIEEVQVEEIKDMREQKEDIFERELETVENVVKEPESVSVPVIQEEPEEIKGENIDIVNTVSLEDSKEVERKQEISDSIEPVSSIFDTFDQSLSASSIYKVYMVREEDSLESILSKYKISREELEKYNNIAEMKKGDKLIIPTVESEKN